MSASGPSGPLVYFSLPDYHSNPTHLFYKSVKLTKFSSAGNRADSYMKLSFTEILIKIKNKLTLNFLAFLQDPGLFQPCI